jgi:hypothetical protein
VLITDPRWIPWSLDTDSYALVKVTGDAVTDLRVDLEQCLESARVLDWLLKVDQEDVEGTLALALLRSLSDVLELSHTLCQFGRSATLSVSQMHLMVDAWVRRSGVHE